MAVIYKPINNNPGYYRAIYGGVDNGIDGKLVGGIDVLINEEGHFNLSKICSEYTDAKGRHPKRFSDWKGINTETINNFRRKYIAEGGDRNKFLYKVGGVNEIKGSYGIDMLAIKVGSWTNKDFEWDLTKISRDFLVKQRDERIRRLTAEKSELQTKVDLLNTKLDAVLAQGAANYNALAAQNRETHHKLDIVTDELDDVKEELNVVSTRVEVLVKEVVPPNKHKDLEERVGFMKLNNPDYPYQFKAYRAQKCHVDRAKSDILANNPAAKLWLETPVNPNSVNCLNRLKELYRSGKKGKLVFSYNSIKLNNGTTETMFRQMIDNILAQPKVYGTVDGETPVKTTKKSA